MGAHKSIAQSQHHFAGVEGRREVELSDPSADRKLSRGEQVHPALIHLTVGILNGSASPAMPLDHRLKIFCKIVGHNDLIEILPH
jgi:hypothetical protein